MKTGIVAAVTLALLLVLVIVLLVIEGKIGVGLTSISSTQENYQFCEETRTTAKDFATNLQARINSGEDAKNYYEFQANEGCFEDPRKIEIDEQSKCNLFCKSGSFKVSDKVKIRIDRFCKKCPT